MFKDFDSKFTRLVEDVTSRYSNDGFLIGDFVRIKKTAMKHPKLADKGETFKAKLYEFINTDMLLKVAAVKTEHAALAFGLVTGQEAAGADRWVDVIREYAPGLFGDVMTLPAEVLEIVQLDGNNVAPRQPNSVRGPGNENPEPMKPVKTTKVDQTDAEKHNLPTKNTKIPAHSAKDPVLPMKPTEKK